MKDKHTVLRLACYSVNVSMSIVGNLSPLLFLIFRDIYDISYSQLGLLVLINYSTQLMVDLIFSFFSHKFNIPLTVKCIPYITVTGLCLFAGAPILFSGNVYVGLLLGTVIFSAAAGLGEVLISPVIAAIPAENPDREMSKLHSVYAWGVVAVVVFATLFLQVFGKECWQILSLICCVVPVAGCFLFAKAKIPPMETPERVSGTVKYLKRGVLWICFLAIFLGGAAECTMAQWCSGYIEQALGIPKVWGDLCGVAMFSVMLGLGRTLYAKYGKKLLDILTLSAVGAFVCYLLAVFAPFPIIGLLACALTGFSVAMLWPGNLVLASERIPDGGVFLFAMMAAGGDLGASVVPQAVGILTDVLEQSAWTAKAAGMLMTDPAQLAMKCSMGFASIFPLLLIFVYLWMKKSVKK